MYINTTFYKKVFNYSHLFIYIYVSDMCIRKDYPPLYISQPRTTQQIV